MNLNKNIIIIFLINLLCIYKNETTIYANDNRIYYTVVVNKLNVREKPNLQSNVLAVIDKCEKVEFIEDTKIIVSVQFPNAISQGSMFKIRTSQNTIGYAYSHFLEKYINTPFIINNEKFDIKGSWAKYIDPPNEIIYFLNNNQFKTEWIQYNKDPVIEYGTYAYNGLNKIIIKENNITRAIDVIKINGKITLKENCFIYNPEYYRKK